MKAGMRFTFKRIRCPYCKKMVAENWIIRHKCTKGREIVKMDRHREWLRERLDEDGYLD